MGCAVIPVHFAIKDRGATPRGMRRIHGVAAKKSWWATGLLYHGEMYEKRFTHSHATAAGYTKRSVKYLIRKAQKYGHTYPLVFSGTAQRKTRTANITSTSTGAKVAYPGARVFNFRNPKSQVNMVVEFTTILQSEADLLAKKFDATYDQLINADQATNFDGNL